MRIILGIILILSLFSSSAPAEEAWTVIPAGGKPAYMGIHGGTMPISLLVSNDGTSLFTFVGRTGNDFLDVLRNAYSPLPSIGNSTRVFSRSRAAADLFAGNATATMRVLPFSPDIKGELASNLQPFGLSDEPLRIEGQVVKPESAPAAKSFRPFIWPEYLRPGKRSAR